MPNELKDMPHLPDNEELRLFVSGTLQAIMAGLSTAQPSATAKSLLAGQMFVFGFEPPREVNFDIAITAKRSGTKSGGFKLEVFSVGARADGAVEKEESSVSRVSFTIPTIPLKVKE